MPAPSARVPLRRPLSPCGRSLHRGRPGARGRRGRAPRRLPQGCRRDSSGFSPLIGVLAMQRVLMVECMQEISSFNPVPSGYDSFHVERAESSRAAGSQHGDRRRACGPRARQDITIVPTYAARAGSAGPSSAVGWRQLSGELLEAVEQGSTRPTASTCPFMARWGPRANSIRRAIFSAKSAAWPARRSPLSSLSICMGFSPTGCSGRSTAWRSTTLSARGLCRHRRACRPPSPQASRGRGPARYRPGHDAGPGPRR